MAVFEFSAADLLCNEETNGFCFDDDFEEPISDGKNEKETSFSDGRSVSVPFVHFPCLSEECFAWMLEREKDHLPTDDYLNRLKSGELDVRARKDALDWMLKACAYYNFGELSLHTAISFFDRFVSLYGLPVCESLERGHNRKWLIQLVAVACLSLAAKIEEVNVPLVVDLQEGNPKYLFEGKIIQRMELVILHHLKWKVKAYTPCNFIDYYLRKMNEVEFPPMDLITKSIQVITSTIKGIDFLEFRPSEIAAAVAIYVSGEIQAMDTDKALSGFIGVEKERVVKCIEMIQDLAPFSGNANSYTYTTSSGGSMVLALSGSSTIPKSPSGVLDASTFSYKSDERTPTVGSCSTSSSSENKRRRLDLGDQTSIIGGGGDS